MSNHLKDARVVFVDAIDAEKSHIKGGIPDHIRIIWKDSEGRKCIQILELPAETVRTIKEIPDL